MSEPTERA